MFGLVEILLRYEDTLAEEVLVDELAIGFGDKPGACEQQFIVRFAMRKHLHVGGDEDAVEWYCVSQRNRRI